VISRRQHPDLSGTIDRLVRTKQLVAVLPGVFVAPEVAADPRTQITAASVWAVNGVITGAAAALVTFWSDVRVPVIDVALPNHRAGRAGFRVESFRRIDPDHVMRVDGVAVTRPALTAIDLVRRTQRADAIDVALRTRAATFPEIVEVFRSLPHRRGNELCARLIAESSTEPWSPPERDLHRLLRRAGVTGWIANQSQRVHGQNRAADLRFDKLRLAVEVDGYQIHIRREAFEDDRVRNNAFALDGWTVLHFTPAQIADRPEWVIGQIIEAITMLALRVGMSPVLFGVC